MSAVSLHPTELARRHRVCWVGFVGGSEFYHLYVAYQFSQEEMRDLLTAQYHAARIAYPEQNCIECESDGCDAATCVAWGMRTFEDVQTKARLCFHCALVHWLPWEEGDGKPVKAVICHTGGVIEYDPRKGCSVCDPNWELISPSRPLGLCGACGTMVRRAHATVVQR